MTSTWSIGAGSPSKNALQRRRVGGVEGRGAPRADVARRPLEALGVAAGEDDVGALGCGRSRAVSRPIPALPPITTTVCPSSSRLAGGAVMTGSAICGSIGLGRSAVALRRSPLRSAFTRRVVDLREARERLDRVAQHVERDVGADRERRLLQPLAGLGPERVGAGQPLAVAEQRQEAVRLGVGVRVGGGLRDLGHGCGGAERSLGRADRRGLRVGVGDARHRLVVGRVGSPRMFDATTSPSYSPTWVSGQMPVTSPIAHRRSPARRCSSTGMPRGSALDADGLEADPLDARAPAGGHEQPVAAQLRGRRRAPGRTRRRRGAPRVACIPEPQLDAVAAQRLAERLAERRRLARRARGRRPRRARPRRRSGARPGPARRRPDPPPSTSRRRGTAFMLVASRVPQTPSSSRSPGIGGHDRIGRRSPRRRAAPVWRTPSTSTAPVPASRPVPRSRSMPRSSASAPARRRSSSRP